MPLADESECEKPYHISTGTWHVGILPKCQSVAGGTLGISRASPLEQLDPRPPVYSSDMSDEFEIEHIGILGFEVWILVCRPKWICLRQSRSLTAHMNRIIIH